MNILVTGAGGQLGKTIHEISPKFSSCRIAFHDTDLDITDRSAMENYFNREEVDCVINCAAYTMVDKAESESEKAYRINSEAVSILAELSSRFNFRLIHFSTDYVFDGSKNNPYVESDIANPLSVYGRSKYSGELNVPRSGIDAIIIRTSWLYSVYGNNFVKTILNALKTGRDLSVVFDQTGTPTFAKDLATFTLSTLIELPPEKCVRLFHYSNEGETNWFDFAKTVSEFSGIKGHISPIESKDYFQCAKRPHYSVLKKSLVKKTFRIEIPDWRDSLQLCISELTTG